ncbi:MAG TPA: isoquinoline 1-oxidoreductase [bacterium]|nr:isoquinoline 1-oxidoreductase [bacterium]
MKTMKQDNYEDHLDLDFKDIAAHFLYTNRREFLKLTGGIVVFFTVGGPLAIAQEGRRRGQGLPGDFNAYLRIDEDGRVTCFTGKIEMGQGIITSLAQMLADELDVALESVEMVMGDTDLCLWDMGTFGSMSTRFFGPPLRAAGAEARRALLELASEHLKVPVGRLRVEQGMIVDKTNTKNRVSYGRLSKGRIIERRLDENVVVKSPSEFAIIGKPVTRTDALDKVTGKAKYTGDILLPDILYAKILRPSAHGAKLISVDSSAVKKVEGARIIEDRDFVAVLHKYPDEAEKALSQIKAKFDTPEATVTDTNIFEHLLNIAPGGDIAARGGKLQTGEQRATAISQQTYFDGYVAHAAMETHTALVKIEGNRATVWASTQTPFRAKNEVARALGIPADNVRIITPFVGGAFGGKTNNQQVVEAARLAQLTGKPVQVMWSREEEFFYDRFRPAAVVTIRSGITDQGRMTLWEYHVYFAGERGSQHFYDIPHHRTVVHGSGWRSIPGSHPFGTGAWRAPANNTNTFARESQIDVMATAAGIDPVSFRLEHLHDGKMRRVLEVAADKFGWEARKSPSGRGYGVACGTDAGTHVATMVEVEVDRHSGHVQVKRVVCVQDMGLAINPEGATIQMEGCITMGMGYALTEDIHFKGGEIFDLNFDTYEIPRFSWLPKIETVIIDDKKSPPQGGGEPAIIVMGAVIANAIYDAIGVRLFQLPMSPERVKEAVQKSSSS